MAEVKTKLIDKIDHPEDLRKLKEDELPQVCDELRELIIREAASNPGHFGASLGVVELTVALHYIYNTPYDKLIWDVGHQAYGHKILTGRRKIFNTKQALQRDQRIFPRSMKVNIDSFGVGHFLHFHFGCFGNGYCIETKGGKGQEDSWK